MSPDLVRSGDDVLKILGFGGLFVAFRGFRTPLILIHENLKAPALITIPTPEIGGLIASPIQGQC